MLSVFVNWILLLVIRIAFSLKAGKVESFTVPVQSKRRLFSSSVKLKSKSRLMMDNQDPLEAKWCPDRQIFIDGTINSMPSAQKYITDTIQSSQPLLIFGYGSLCWNPGTGVLSNPLVTTKVGRALGYRRCWSQKSTDHRGDVCFPGLVCTLLRDEEFHSIVLKGEHADDERRLTPEFSMTEGVLFSVPPQLVEECLEELDFREKGGYARDVVKIVLDVENKDESVEALLYRGIPSNPAFSNRALMDELFAAAVISVANGPSGRNDAYLYELDSFLRLASGSSSESEGESLPFGDSLTRRLANLCVTIQRDYNPYFLYGSGSNQHNQLLLETTKMNGYAAKQMNCEEAHDLKEIILLVPKHGNPIQDNTYKPKRLFAGGGHSAMLTHGGSFYIWGWNDSNQLGRNKACNVEAQIEQVIPPLDIKVETAALGHNHTLVIEQGTRFIYAFGEDSSGQVSSSSKNKSNHGSPELTKLDFGRFVDVSAGLFHSAGVTEEGDLVTWGCRRFGQTISGDQVRPGVGRWRPEDGSRLVKVACGRRHTICMDEHGRVYSMGDNKYGQLGRKVEGNRDKTMKPLEGLFGQKGSKSFHIDCGWSHSIILIRDTSGKCRLYGFGRNDKGQLGFDERQPIISSPRPLFEGCVNINVKSASCGAESLSIVDYDNNILSCGWNEHGNLGIGEAHDSSTLTLVQGAKICCPYNPTQINNGDIVIAAGGGHLIAIRAS